MCLFSFVCFLLAQFCNFWYSILYPKIRLLLITFWGIVFTLKIGIHNLYFITAYLNLIYYFIYNVKSCLLCNYHHFCHSTDQCKTQERYLRIHLVEDPVNMVKLENTSERPLKSTMWKIFQTEIYRVINMEKSSA